MQFMLRRHEEGMNVTRRRNMRHGKIKLLLSITEQTTSTSHTSQCIFM